jgi:hypothetical protein
MPSAVRLGASARQGAPSGDRYAARTGTIAITETVRPARTPVTSRPSAVSSTC